MKAAIYQKYGSPAVLQIADLAPPTPTKNQVLIKVAAAAINPKDAALRSGEMRMLMNNKFPKQIGSDFAGTVIDRGAKAKRFKVGDAVYGYIDFFEGGAMSEYLCIADNKIAHCPATANWVATASLPCAYLTALQALRDKAHISKGKRVLIYGASGGVGTAAIQLAKYYKAHITTISSTKNIAYCLAQGADVALSYETTNIFDYSKSNEKQFDIFFQVYIKREELFAEAKTIMSSDGVFLTLNPRPDIIVKAKLQNLYNKQKYYAIVVKSRPKDLRLLAQLYDTQRIVPTISQVYPLTDIVQAHQQIDSKHTRGKLVVRV